MPSGSNLQYLFFHPLDQHHCDARVFQLFSARVLSHERVGFQDPNIDRPDAISQSEDPVHTGQVAAQSRGAGLDGGVEDCPWGQYFCQPFLLYPMRFCQLDQTRLFCMGIPRALQRIARRENRVRLLVH